MKLVIMILAIFSCIGSQAQNARDIFIKDSVQSILNTDLIENRAQYEVLKKRIKSLEAKYGYETNLKRRMLEPAFKHNDINYFKAEMATLVKEHGLHVAYMSGLENYYSAILNGEHAAWFKKMYLKNNSTWLKNNFDKQIDLRKLNALHEKDQYITRFAMEVLNIRGIDSVQQEQVKKLLANYYKENISTLINASVKRNAVPNEKNFAALQNGYDTALIHNFQFKNNLESVWKILFPYFKKAYMYREINDNVFRNYDFYCYQHNGYQEFDSFTIEQIPEQFRKDSGPIRLKDPEWLNGIKKEFGWNK